MDVHPAVPERVELDVGEQRTLPLPNRAAGGYRWSVDVSGDCVDASISYAESEPRSGSDSMLGQVLQLAGVRAGEALLTLSERRSWEQGEPADAVQVRVLVRARDRPSDQSESSREGRHG